MFSNKFNVNIKCQWIDCDYNTSSLDNFYKHVKNHLPDLEVVTDENGEECYKCLWVGCIFQTKDSDEVTWHVKYHGYHTILKAQGDVKADNRNLPACTLSTVDCNTIPTRAVPVCEWGSCNEEINGQIEFIQHVNCTHISFLEVKSKERWKCQWKDCTLSTTKRSKLADHVKMHTGDKAYACSHCGQIFANTAKFVNHRNRQISINEDSPQCSHCSVFLPNETLLKIHMRQHVHHYKCCFCDLTCSTPSILSTHIKYRHLPYKPYKCTSCPHVCKSQNDLNNHMMIHSDNYFECTHVGCSSKYRTEFSLAKHFEKVHTANPQLSNFACHLCNKTYSRGAQLTTHLCSVHNVTKPSGYSRFEYKRQQDGYFRLQTTRLESLEVEEMAFAHPALNLNKTLSCMQDEEEIDDPSPVINKGGTEVTDDTSKIVEIEVLDEEGKVITYNVTRADIELPPEAKVVAVGGE